MKIFYYTTRVIKLRNTRAPSSPWKIGGEASLIRDGVYVIKAYVTGSRGCTSPEDEI